MNRGKGTAVKLKLLISARPQRQTNAEGCLIFGDLDQLKSKEDTKNGRLIPTAKRGKKITLNPNPNRPRVFYRHPSLQKKPLMVMCLMSEDFNVFKIHMMMMLANMARKFGVIYGRTSEQPFCVQKSA